MLQPTIKVSKYKADIVTILVIICITLSPFYFWKSGIPQPSQIILLLSMVIYTIYYRQINIKHAKILLLFILYITLNNLLWFFVNDFDSSYLLSIVFWWFNFFTFILITNLRLKSLLKFQYLILYTIAFSYGLQIIIWMFNLGRYNYGSRYNGLFNDPNQMAFWVLATCSIYLYLSKNKLLNIAIFSVATFLILLTFSRSAGLGLPFLLLALILKQESSFINKILTSFIYFITITSVIFWMYIRGFFDDFIDRVQLGVDSSSTQVEDRGFTALTDYPEHLIFGAGQGGYDLYTSNGLEIHSTWLGLLFYYGITGLSLFILFLYGIYKKLTIPDKLLFIGPMLYGLTTYSARTSIFWFLISIISLVINAKSTNNET